MNFFCKIGLHNWKYSINTCMKKYELPRIRTCKKCNKKQREVIQFGVTYIKQGWQTIKQELINSL